MIADIAPYIPSGGAAGKLRRLNARLRARRAMAARPARGMVSFSFDDFPKSAADAGAAIIERAGARATFYGAAGFAGTQTHHGAMFDGRDLARLAAAGHEIGCHTFSHLDCARAPVADVLKEADRNAQALRAMGHQMELRSFAFPYGEAAPAAKRALAGRFASLRGVRPGAVPARADANLLPAFGLDGGPAGLNRVLAALEDAAKTPAWIIVFAHDVQDEPTPWGCTPDMLSRAVEAARALDLDILTVGDAAARLDGAAFGGRMS